MNKLFITIVFSILASIICSCAAATTPIIYVSNDSVNNSTTCGGDQTAENACSDIQSALASFQASSGPMTNGSSLTISMSPGRYFGEMNANLKVYNQTVFITCTEAATGGHTTIDLTNVTSYFLEIDSSLVDNPNPTDTTTLTVSSVHFTNLNISKPSTPLTGIVTSDSMPSNVDVTFNECTFNNISTPQEGTIVRITRLGGTQSLNINSCVFTNVVSIGADMFHVAHITVNINDTLIEYCQGVWIINQIYGELHISNSQFENNVFEQALIFQNMVKSLGNTNSITNSTFSNNQCFNRSLIVASESNLVLSTSTFQGSVNTSAIQIGQHSDVLINQTLFTDNNNTIAGQVGGQVVVVDDSNVNITSCTFSKNIGVSGSAISVLASDPFNTVIIIDTLFTNNTALDFGGAIYTKMSAVSVNASQFIGNKAYSAAGAIYSVSYSNVTLSNVNMTDNIGQGGAIVCGSYSSVIINDVQSSGNFDTTNNIQKSTLVTCLSGSGGCTVSGTSSDGMCPANHDSSSDRPRRGLTSGQIAGIVIGVLVGVAILVCVIYIFLLYIHVTSRMLSNEVFKIVAQVSSKIDYIDKQNIDNLDNESYKLLDQLTETLLHFDTPLKQCLRYRGYTLTETECCSLMDILIDLNNRLYRFFTSHQIIVGAMQLTLFVSLKAFGEVKDNVKRNYYFTVVIPPLIFKFKHISGNSSIRLDKIVDHLNLTLIDEQLETFKLDTKNGHEEYLKDRDARISGCLGAWIENVMQGRLVLLSLTSINDVVTFYAINALKEHEADHVKEILHIHFTKAFIDRLYALYRHIDGPIIDNSVKIVASAVLSSSICTSIRNLECPATFLPMPETRDFIGVLMQHGRLLEQEHEDVVFDSLLMLSNLTSDATDKDEYLEIAVELGLVQLVCDLTLQPLFSHDGTTRELSEFLKPIHFNNNNINNNNNDSTMDTTETMTPTTEIKNPLSKTNYKCLFMIVELICVQLQGTEGWQPYVLEFINKGLLQAFLSAIVFEPLAPSAIIANWSSFFMSLINGPDPVENLFYKKHFLDLNIVAYLQKLSPIFSNIYWDLCDVEDYQ
ncbi:hypothetical protein DFA_06919 [Cavenderia fasciculata]|uniref:Right handed beta helix domain-containing protein n=1 Tax=Cavenderia fasciculata TaxID=261658 RepID=F4PX14_CACFS|nr:uncharacterized protein DFA_06919 [Cavenderia fasciculata]EGG19817.1 hypothetical protein DFA_06919 [Cavenderia fasciculata]|eukprot:XP_004358163.1 hypothetical protein DFA_06919 [Cavenderia fasciculata]